LLVVSHSHFRRLLLLVGKDRQQLLFEQGLHVEQAVL
jgi:hypothetical protein